MDDIYSAALALPKRIIKTLPCPLICLMSKAQRILIAARGFMD